MHRFLALIALGTLLAGCATSEPALPPPAPAPLHAPAGDPLWWQVKIQMGYEPGQAVAWHVDALLADQVFAPVLARYRPAMLLWRFHRRAVSDASGHQMSLLFLADTAIASRIMTALRSSAVLGDLISAGIVRAVLLPKPGESLGPELEATSDKNWPAAIQRTWPRFIMGVSDSWLALIGEVRAEHGLPPQRPIEGLMDAYAEINAAVNELWRVQAQHAYLHHLNAVFGYQPLVLREQRLMRF